MEIKNMKKAYIKPTMENEEFVPNQFVAACENPSSYVGYCDISGRVYLDNGNGVYDEGIDTYKYTNSACNKMYESQIEPHFNAFVVEREWIPGHWEGGWPDYHWVDGYYKVTKVTKVFNYMDVHVTQHIDTNKHYNVSI